MSRDARIRETPTECFSQTVRLAIHRQPRPLYCVAHEPAEAVDSERLPKVGVQDRDVLSWCGVDCMPQFIRYRHDNRDTSFLTLISDAVEVDLSPCHLMYVNPCCADIQH